MAEEMAVDCIDVRTIQPFVNADDRGSDEAAFWDKIKRCRATLDEWLGRTGVQDLGYLRTTNDKIDLYDGQGGLVPCNAAFENLAILFNGEVVPCTAWSRSPLGNLAHQSFDEIWNGAAARAMRDEFAEKKPGRDCHYCTIIRDDPEVEGDAFFKLITRAPAASEPPSD
jgi:radical SAM protein with 4Fe4S-binding SPASM domain